MLGEITQQGRERGNRSPLINALPPRPVTENVSENRLPAQTGDVAPARLRWARSPLPLQLSSSEYRTFVFESFSPAIILTSVFVFECADSSFPPSLSGALGKVVEIVPLSSTALKQERALKKGLCHCIYIQFSSVQSLSHVRLFATP